MKNIHSVYTWCLECHGWGINIPGNKICADCGSDNTVLYFDSKTIAKEINSIKKWLKGRNIPTETKDELRRRLNKIGGI